MPITVLTDLTKMTTGELILALSDLVNNRVQAYKHELHYSITDLVDELEVRVIKKAASGDAAVELI